ncbi:MAG: hypothetical protein JW918_00985 [Anaerolineae bacterium]|nr:hypothetical protein [Anaerolineae bacterium]
MEGIPSEVLIIGGLVLAGVAVLIVARYAKQILAFFLIVGGLLALGVIAWAMLQTPSTPSTEGSGALHDVADIARVFAPKPEPAHTAPAPSGGGFCAGVLVALLAGALGVGGYFFARWKLVEWGGLPTKSKKRRKRQSGAPLVYVVPQGQDFDGLADLWDLEGVTEWQTENDCF